MRLQCESLEVRENPTGFTPKVPVELWQQLAADVKVLVQGTVPPSQESVAVLQSTYQSAIADGVISAKESVQLYNATLGVLNSANIPVSEIQAVAADLQAIKGVWVG
jgi:hypothetical protein